MFGGQAGAEALGGRTRGHAERAIPEIPPVGPAEQRDGERRIGVFQPRRGLPERGRAERRSEEHTSELQSPMRIPYDVFCVKKKKMYIHKDIGNTANTKK